MSDFRRKLRLYSVIATCSTLIIAGLALTACNDKEEIERAVATVAPFETAAPTSTPSLERQWAFRGQRGITAAFVPTNLGLYRSLLPTAFDMPESPLIAVAVVNYYDVTLPLTPYSEGYVVMQCRYKRRTGWYVLTMPVDDETANVGGRSLGFPKYVADKIELTEANGVWNGGVAYQARDVMRITFTPSPDTKPAETSSSDPGLPVFLLVPPEEGPQVNEVDMHLFGARKTVTTAGSAIVQADPGEAWAGLLPADGVPISVTLDEMTGEWILTGRQP
jgi:Acetoacetate decarboxylase (ADC)